MCFQLLHLLFIITSYNDVIHIYYINSNLPTTIKLKKQIMISVSLRITKTPYMPCEFTKSSSLRLPQSIYGLFELASLALLNCIFKSWKSIHKSSSSIHHLKKHLLRLYCQRKKKSGDVNFATGVNVF